MISNLGFPSHLASPQEKASKEYGVQFAYAMLGYYGLDGSSSMFYSRNLKLQNLYKIAQGQQTTTDIANVMGFTNNSLGMGPQNVDIKVLNLATKFVNTVVQMIAGRSYIPTTSVVDPLALDTHKNQVYLLEAFYELKSYMDKINLAYDKLFPNIDVSAMPDTLDEALMDANMKFSQRLTMESDSMLMLLTQTANDLQEIRRLVCYDLAVAGLASTYTYADYNGYPRTERIDPRNLLTSSSKDESFKDLSFAGDIRYLSIPDFLALTQDEFTTAEQNEIVEKYAVSTSYGMYYGSFDNGMTGRGEARPIDGQKYIPTLRFEFLTQNRHVYEAKNNSVGNRIVYEKSSKYKPTQEYLEKYKGEREFYAMTTAQIYGGYYVIGSGSGFVFDYGLKPSYKEGLVNTSLNYTVFAPNSTFANYSSLLEQMLEPMYMLNIAYNRIKGVVAANRSNALEISLDDLEDITLTGGGNISVADVLDLFLGKQILLKRSKGLATQDIAPSQSAPAIREISTGLNMGDYLNVMAMCMNQIREITGINSTVDSSSPIPGQLNGVTQAGVQAAQNALGYLYNGDYQIYKGTCYKLLTQAQLSIMGGKTLSGNIVDALGMNTVKFFQSNSKLAWQDLGLIITVEAPEAEWTSLYMSLDKSLANGVLMPSDAVYIRSIKSLKMAEQQFIVRENKRRRERMQEAQANMMAQSKANQESVIAASQARQQELQMEMQMKGQLMAQENQFKLEQIKLQGQIDAMLKGMDIDTAKLKADTAASAVIGGKAVTAKGQQQIQAMKNEHALLLHETALTHERELAALEKQQDMEADKEQDMKDIKKLNSNGSK